MYNKKRSDVALVSPEQFLGSSVSLCCRHLLTTSVCAHVMMEWMEQKCFQTIPILLLTGQYCFIPILLLTGQKCFIPVILLTGQ